MFSLLERNTYVKLPKKDCVRSGSVYLLHIADHWGEFKPLALGVDGVQTSHQVLQEQLEGLGQAEHRLVVDHEGGDLLAPVVDDLAVVRSGVVGTNHGRGRAGVGTSLE